MTNEVRADSFLNTSDSASLGAITATGQSASGWWWPPSLPILHLLAPPTILGDLAPPSSIPFKEMNTWSVNNNVNFLLSLLDTFFCAKNELFIEIARKVLITLTRLHQYHPLIRVRLHTDHASPPRSLPFQRRSLHLCIKVHMTARRRKHYRHFSCKRLFPGIGGVKKFHDSIRYHIEEESYSAELAEVELSVSLS